jgi:hypothetical protein
LKQYDKAIDYADKAKNNFLKSENKIGIGVSLYRLSLIYSEKKDYDRSIKTLLEAKKIFEDTHNTSFLTNTNLQIGADYRSKKEYDLALNYYNIVLASAQQMGDKDLIATAFQNIGTIYDDKGDKLKALEFYKLADGLFIEVENRIALIQNSSNFIDVYSHLNQSDSVLKYFNRYQELSDSLFSEQSTKSIAEMQTKYETEKKDKEIFKLNLENEKRKNNIQLLNNLNEITKLKLKNSTIENEKKSQDLILANTEKEKQQANIEIYKLNEANQAQVLQDEKDRKHSIILSFIIGLIVLTCVSLLSFKNYQNKKEKEKALLSRQVAENDMKALRSQMNPHFIFNCVQTIEQLLNDAKINESKTCLIQFSNLTRSVLENSKKREISLEEEIETLKLYMYLENLRFKNPFSYSINIEPGIDTQTTLVPPLILQPFVENSIKHGFQGLEKSGHLTIEVKKENESLICIIEDNGIGRKNSLSLKPLSGFKKESIGMKLTEERLQLIGEMKKTKCYFMFDDLADSNNKPIGTRVKMFLPYELSV